MRRTVGVCALVAIVTFAHAESRLLKSLDLKLDRAWTPTGVQVKSGDTLSIVARGRITSSGMTVGPEGASGTKALNDPEASYTMSTAKPLAVIGKVGDAEPFVIGARVTVIAKTAGVLSIGVNDDQFGDNKGQVSVSVYAGTAPGRDDAAPEPFEGSTWRTCAGAQNNVQFLASGEVRMEKTECAKAKYKRDGDKVTFTCGTSSYELALAGDDLIGETWSGKSKRTPACFKRGLLVAQVGKQPKGATTQGTPANAKNNATKSDAGSTNPSLQRARDDGQCPAGTRPLAGKCASCPAGTTLKPSGLCRGPCPSGLTEWNDSCWSCPSGYDWVGNGWCRRPCTSDEISWADSCYVCPPDTTWAGNGWCKPTTSP